jgi:hypothetical protein
VLKEFKFSTAACKRHCAVCVCVCTGIVYSDCVVCVCLRVSVLETLSGVAICVAICKLKLVASEASVEASYGDRIIDVIQHLHGAMHSAQAAVEVAALSILVRTVQYNTCSTATDSATVTSISTKHYFSEATFHVHSVCVCVRACDCVCMCACVSHACVARVCVHSPFHLLHSYLLGRV